MDQLISLTKVENARAPVSAKAVKPPLVGNLDVNVMTSVLRANLEKFRCGRIANVNVKVMIVVAYLRRVWLEEKDRIAMSLTVHPTDVKVGKLHNINTGLV